MDISDLIHNNTSIYSEWRADVPNEVNTIIRSFFL